MNEEPNTQTYHQPPPTQQSPTPPPTPQPQEPWYYTVWRLFVETVNFLGTLLVSNQSVGALQKVLNSHFEVHNYLLRNITSIKFWKLNFKYSLLLTILLAVKGLFMPNHLSLEVTGVFCLLSYLIVNFQLNKGQIDYNGKEEELYIQSVPTIKGEEDHTASTPTPLKVNLASNKLNNALEERESLEDKIKPLQNMKEHLEDSKTPTSSNDILKKLNKI